MVRRVGFGSDPKELERTVVGRGDTSTAALREPEPAGPQTEVQGERPMARLLVVLLLALFVAGWSYAIFWGFGAFGELYTRPSDAFDLAALLFTGLWLAFALIGWAFAVVILVVLLFGKPVSPERRAEKQTLRAARRRARQTDRD